MKKYFLLLFVILATTSKIGISFAEGYENKKGLANSPWPMFHHDLQHTGRSPYKGPTTPNIRWSYITGYPVYYSSPTIGTDGTLYVGGNSTYKLYAINSDGSLKWSYPTGSVNSSPAIDSSGTIYVGSGDYKFYAINPDGSLKWSYSTIFGIFSPAISCDGTVYMASYYTFYALNLDGSLKWSFTTPGYQIESCPAIGTDGTIYLSAGIDGKIYTLDPNGSLKWSFTLDGNNVTDPSISSDGTIYVADCFNKLYALNPNGSLKWSYVTGGDITSSPSIGSDGTIYATSQDHKLYAINPNGLVKWSFTTNSYIYGSSVIGSDGTIYFGSNDSALYAINPDGSIKWSIKTGCGIGASPSIGSDGTIYISTFMGKLCAIDGFGIISPKGGEVYIGGSIHNIIWWCENSTTLDHYRLLYSIDGGKTYPDTIVDNIINTDTSYLWTVPFVDSSTCRVKIQLLDNTNNIISDAVSDSNFKIQTSLTVTAPKTSDILPGNSLQNVTWSVVGQDFGNYRLLYTKNATGWIQNPLKLSSPHPYTNNYDTTWVISCPGAQNIRLHFDTLNTDSAHDIVYIYDKKDSQIVTYDNVKRRFWTPVIPGDTAKIRLVTDTNTQGYGFDVSGYMVHCVGSENYLDTIVNMISPDSVSYPWYVPNGTFLACKVKIQMLNLSNNVICEGKSGCFSIIETGVEEKNTNYTQSVIHNPQLEFLRNPVFQLVTITYQIPVKSKVSLCIYDISGRKVKTLVNGEKTAGSYSLNFNTKELTTGIYFVKLIAENYKDTKKLIFMK
ncbi:MAG: PQQ-binding-like beta-propeller repeat protein [bacterium]|nr:PQQ-binding-like beta-propeller repeat protein [bacterium]